MFAKHSTSGICVIVCAPWKTPLSRWCMVQQEERRKRGRLPHLLDIHGIQAAAAAPLRLPSSYRGATWEWCRVWEVQNAKINDKELFVGKVPSSTTIHFIPWLRSLSTIYILGKCPELVNLPAITTILTCDAVICAQFKRTNSDVQFGNYSELGSPAFTAHNDDARPGRAEQSRAEGGPTKAGKGNEFQCYRPSLVFVLLVLAGCKWKALQWWWWCLWMVAVVVVPLTS